MKKYIFTKGEESVTVETDGLGKINDFIVTGVISTTGYSTLIREGFDFKVGDTQTMAFMQNIAKVCECSVECYEGGVLVADETNDYTVHGIDDGDQD